MTTRTCKVCGCQKEAIQGIWVMAYGKPTGQVCRACKNAAQLEKQRSLVTLPTGEVVTYAAAANRKVRATPEGREALRARNKRQRLSRLAKQRYAEALSRANNPRQPAANRRWYATLIQATPKWLSKAQWAEMDAIYLDSYQKGPDWSVDHIVGLTARNIDGDHIACGLNVPWNLQVMLSTDNAAKGQYLYDEQG